jgi:hypothetical protein
MLFSFSYLSILKSSYQNIKIKWIRKTSRFNECKIAIVPIWIPQHFANHVCIMNWKPLHTNTFPFGFFLWIHLYLSWISCRSTYKSYGCVRILKSTVMHVIQPFFINIIEVCLQNVITSLTLVISTYIFMLTICVFLYVWIICKSYKHDKGIRG